MVITIETNKEKYFRQVLELLAPVPPYSQLTKRERDVLSSMVLRFYSSDAKSLRERFEEVFSPDAKEDMRIKCDMSKAVLDNYLSALRRKQFITYDKICEISLVKPDEYLVYKFKTAENNDN